MIAKTRIYWMILISGVLCYVDTIAQNTYKTDVFMYGASVYPEF
jgi:hypothetical protein